MFRAHNMHDHIPSLVNLTVLHGERTLRCPGSCRSLLLWLLHNNCLGSQHHSSHGCCVLQRASCHLGRVNHTSLHQVLILVSHGVVTELPFTLLDFIYNHFTFNPGVMCYQCCRCY
uniref:Uncharacterized protein n=1 Tax=Arundo donax TaxID=35708 RepID=A0A0A9DXQ2_ARUDO